VGYKYTRVKKEGGIYTKMENCKGPTRTRRGNQERVHEKPVQESL